jgi:hypothetical protein
VDVAVARGLALMVTVDLEAAAAFSREIPLAAATTPFDIEAVIGLAGRTGGAVDLSEVLEERAESLGGLEVVAGGRNEETDPRGVAREAAEGLAEGGDAEEVAVGSGGAVAEDVEGRGRAVVPVLAPPRAPLVLTEEPRAAGALAPFVRGAGGGATVEARDVEATLDARDAVVAAVIREAVLVVESRGVRVVAAVLVVGAVA